MTASNWVDALSAADLPKDDVIGLAIAVSGDDAQGILGRVEIGDHRSMVVVMRRRIRDRGMIGTAAQRCDVALRQGKHIITRAAVQHVNIIVSVP